MSVQERTPDHAAMPNQLLRLMSEAEYHIACADASEVERVSALTELIDWLHDLRITVYTGVPTADSDVFPTSD